MTFALSTMVAIYLIGLVLLPVTFWKDTLYARGINLPGLIIMRRGLDIPGATWAQEYYEAKRGWKYLPVHAVMIPLGRAFPKVAAYEREQELHGHEITVHAEHRLAGTPYINARQRQAIILSKAYRVFKGWTPTRIEKAMHHRSATANEFVNKHFELIQKMNKP